MRHLHKQLPFLLVFVTMLFTNCKKGYLDVNNDPNRVTDQNVTPELIFPAAAETAGALSIGGRADAAGANTNMVFTNHWVGYMSSNMDFARDAQETSYNIDFSFGDALWIFRYDNQYDLHTAELKGLAAGDTSLAGAAIVLSCKGYQELVDIYGDIPYSQAFKVATISLPAYDKSQDIYNNLELRLDTAIQYLSHPLNPAFTAADIVNKGDLKKWIKFANTIKLRLLIRQSEVSGFDPSAEITKIMATGGPLGVGETVSVNPGYVNDVDKQSPFYANYGYTTTGVQANTSNDAGLYIVTILQNDNDDRIGRFFLPVSGQYVGNRYGDIQANLSSGATSSYFGPGLIGTYPSGATQNQQIMPSYESMFFVAEAMARGWMPGNAQTEFEAAIHESFSYLGVSNPDSAAAAIIANNTDAQYANAGATPLSKAQFIAYQKYIANCNIDPLESWSDIRRLNMLTDNSYISANVNKVSNTLPVRLLYPVSEYSTNAKNTPVQTSASAFSTKLFWEP